MNDFSVFLPLEKVVEEPDGTCLVYTRGAQEVPDRTGQIMDYETTKPHVQAWSDSVFKASGGKSYGNIRAMHKQDQASGKLDEPIGYNDDEKAFDFVIKVIDPVDVKKCVEGVYTGMSIGGSYASRPWPDSKNPRLQRYTGIPKEWSLVDTPAIPTATFALVKTDGSEELKKFTTTVAPEEVVSEQRAVLEEPVVPNQTYAVVQIKDAAPNPLGHGIHEMDLGEVQKVIEKVLDSKMDDLAAFVAEKVAKVKITEAKELAKKAGDRSGLPLRERSSLTPPNGFPEERDAYGDPANYQWRYDNREELLKRVKEFNGKALRKQYSDREWHLVARRLESKFSKYGLLFKYDPKEQRFQEVKKVGDKFCSSCGSKNSLAAKFCSDCGNKVELAKAAPSGVANDLRAAAQNALEHINDPEAVMNALHQIIAGIDVATDVSTLKPDPTPGSGKKEVAPSAQSTAKTTEPKGGDEEKEESVKTQPETPESTPAESPESDKMSSMEKRLDQLTSVLASLLKTPALQKSGPIGNLNSPVQIVEPELSPLEKALTKAAAGYEDGIGGEQVLEIMKSVGGDLLQAQGKAVALAQKSLAARGFSSGAKIKLLDPTTVERIRGASR